MLGPLKRENLSQHTSVAIEVSVKTTVSVGLGAVSVSTQLREAA